MIFFTMSLALLFLILLADHVKNRFQHTIASRRVLAWQAVLAGAAAVAGSLVLWPHPSLLVRAGSGLLVGVPLYILMAFLTVELWRYRKQGGYDREITRLLRDRNRWQEALDRLTWELNDIEKQKARQDEEGQHQEVRRRALEDQLQAWEQGGQGLTRLFQVQKWSSELGGLSPQDLAGRKASLQAELAGGDGEERAALAAQLTLIDLTLLRQPGGEGGVSSHLHQRLSQCQDARFKAEKKLEQVKQELREWQERKLAFLRGKISLD